jgi:hypothetical protein
MFAENHGGSLKPLSRWRILAWSVLRAVARESKLPVLAWPAAEAARIGYSFLGLVCVCALDLRLGLSQRCE